ncbi:hypothetical protein GGX14DRAFT_348768 [Mycena pura]|uniref:Mediator of RNA polymerase II transcription subunit 5 n=1 Tax=Mycena pura TaxID=153505 RepID=A0AAD6YP58_9AGAR|nr:hypothetical protein GGX14DRAFT_348768 [Mycena pura]
MSLDDLTRNSFQSGISPQKWISLCKMFLAKQSIFDSPQLTQRALSNSVLVLYRSFPGDPVLQEYLKIALQTGKLSIAIFVSTLLSAARSTELHAPATLDMLCRIALDTHYSSGLSSAALSYYDSPVTVSNTLQDALALLRVAHELPMSHFHQLTTSASELVALLFSSADISQVPPSQCIVLLGDANSMLTLSSISQNVRQVLESFTLSLGLLVGDEAKASNTPDAHLMHNFHLALGKSDSIGSSNTDTVSCSLTLGYLLSHRADEFGAGSGTDPGALLVSMFRRNSWAPPVFYTQLLLSAFICLSESASVSPLIWRAFIVGRLPYILISFEKILNSDGATPENWASSHANYFILLIALFSEGGPTSGCNLRSTASRILVRDFLRQLLLCGLLDQTFVLTMDPTFSNDTTVYMQSEAQAELGDLDAYFSSKLSPDMAFEDVRLFIERTWNDSQSHKAFSEVALRRFKISATSLDTETLSHLCRIFYLFDAALDIISLQSKISDLIFHALLCLQEFDCETVGDPQTAVSDLGDVVLFLQSTLTRFHLETDTYTSGGRSISSGFLRSTAVVHRLNDLSSDDAVAFNAWYKALFDSSSEGIEDTILRSTKPKALLRISASLFSHAIKDPNIDEDVLNNGISYFNGPLLRWTLVGVVQALTREIQLQGFSAPKHFNILQTLLLSSECPRPVKCLCGQGIVALLADKRVQNSIPPLNIDTTAMYHVVSHALGVSNGGKSSQSQTAALGSHILEHPRQAIRDAIAKARASKAPNLDLERCIKICGCEKFLRILWSELVSTANLGETDVCTRIATFALTMPRPLGSPPVLAIFLNIVLPSLISSIDSRPAGDQTVPTELLGSIVLSILTASLHLDLVFSDVSRPVLGQASVTMARRVAADLRSRAKKQSTASKMILKRLSSSQAIVANFPIFKADS